MKTIELNEQQIEFLINSLSRDLEEVKKIGYKTGEIILQQIINKLEQ